MRMIAVHHFLFTNTFHTVHINLSEKRNNTVTILCLKIHLHFIL